MEFYVTVDGKDVRWEWKDKVKQFWETWRPTEKQVVILDDVDDVTKRKAVASIMVGVEEENEMVREKINRQAKERRKKRNV
tara:strand:- start:2639 stop:2881 length:243 start_codon:yes stop_codon:yes gene_type:complete